MQRTDKTEYTVKKETFEFQDPPEGAVADTYTRKSIDGRLKSWTPHDDHGPLQFGTSSQSPSSAIQDALEEMYWNFRMVDEELMQDAREARSRAFAPYSEYEVGAAVMTNKGVFKGANVEVSGRSTSTHAEMLAMFNAVFNGATQFHAMAVSPQDQSGDVAPCGLCQHTMSQFTDELRILEDVGKNNGDHTEFWLSELIGDGYSASTRHFETLLS